MNLTLYSDYALRVLIFLAAHPDKLACTEDISAVYKISRNHLIKVVHKLGREGFLEIRRGRNGGIRLAKPPEQIRIGDVIRCTEPNFHTAECFNPKVQRCPIIPVCGLRTVLGTATKSFFDVLDQHTLASVIQMSPGGRARLSSLLTPAPPASAPGISGLVG